MRLVTIAAAITFVFICSSCGQNPQAGGRGATGGGQAQSETAVTEKPVDPKALMRELADFYRQKQTFQVDYEQTFAMELPSMRHAMESRAQIVVERPNRIAIRQGDPQLSSDVICDGNDLFISLAALKQYFQSPAPSSLDGIIANPMVMTVAGGRGPLLELFCNNPYESLMDGVTDIRYVRREKIGEVDAYRLKLSQEHYDWDIWINAEGDPHVVQAKFDMSKSHPAGGASNSQPKGAKIVVTQQYKNWVFDSPPNEKDFNFHPPAGSHRMDSPFDEHHTAGHPLIGQAAPDIEQELLDGRHFSLKELKGEKVVILDFWGVWCHSCVPEMLILAKVADHFRDKDVALYCINQRDHTDKIRRFLDEKKLNVPVSLDPDGVAGGAYGAVEIPMLVLIDKAGVVQSIHVGFRPDIRKILTEEIDKILAGKSLAPKRETTHDVEASEPLTKNLELAWKKPGRYSGIDVADGGKTIVALKSGVAEFFDASGNLVKSLQLSPTGDLVRSARLQGAESNDLLLFGIWGIPLTAIDADGKQLWTQTAGIDDVWAADLDHDGKDEIIVGYNGAEGVHVFSSDGELRWKDTSIANVWHVTAGDLDGDGTMEVVTASASGEVDVFDSKGQSVNTFDAGTYASMVRVFRLPGESADSLLVIGAGSANAQFIAMNGKGEQLWHAEISGKSRYCDSLAVAKGSHWAAARFRGGSMSVFDLQTGKEVAEGHKLGMTMQVAWINLDGQPLLVATTSAGLMAWRVNLGVELK